MQKKIIFIKPAFSACFGSFGVDDVGYFSAEVAAHFVNDAQCAIYASETAAAPTPTPTAAEVPVSLAAEPVVSADAPAEPAKADEPATDPVQTPAPDDAGSATGAAPKGKKSKEVSA